MKKTLYTVLTMTLALGLGACQEEPFRGEPVVNPQEPVIAAGVAQGTNIYPAAGYDLQSAKAEGSVPVITLTLQEALPEGYTPSVVMKYSKNEDMSGAVTLPVILNGQSSPYTGVIEAETWASAFKSLYGLSPAAKDGYVTFDAYAVNGNSQVSLGTVGTPAAKVNVTPFESEVMIEDGYYLVGGMQGWSIAEAIAFRHNGDGSVYDSPTFTVSFTVTEDQVPCGWKIVPLSTFSTGNWVDATDSQFAPNDDPEAPEGVLEGSVLSADGKYDQPSNGTITEAGSYVMTINMMERTYEIIEAYPALYVAGDAQGWNPGTAPALLPDDKYINYRGFSGGAPGGLKFCTAPDWANPQFGGADAIEVAENGTVTGSIALGADNVNDMPLGLYFFNVSLESYTFTATPITTIGVIGDGTPAGWGDDTPLQPVIDDHGIASKWTAVINFTAGEFKFRANGNWDYNLGGNPAELEANGANIPVPGEGAYEVTLDLSTHPAVCTFVKQ